MMPYRVAGRYAQSAPKRRVARALIFQLRGLFRSVPEAFRLELAQSERDECSTFA